MSRAKRYHPLVMLLGIWNLGKNTVYFFFFLFVLKAGSDTAWVKYGRLALFAAAGIGLLSIGWSWLTRRYQLDDTSFRLESGVFVKSKKVIPFAKIQNTNRHTTLFHRIFKVTAIRFETGMEGDDAAVEFRVISYAEADRLEKRVAGLARPEEDSDAADGREEQVAAEAAARTASPDSTRSPEGPRTPKPERMLHFSPTRKDLIKASFTSLSFLVLIPVLFSLYSKAEDFIDLEDTAQGLLAMLMSSWWLAAAVIVLLSGVSVALGIAVTFYKYGKFEISSDEERIYIAKGMVETTVFSIAKEKVQGVEITQSLMKRLLSLAEVRLITAGGAGDEEREVNSLYPFLPVQRAYCLIAEMLPAYEISPEMSPLPRRSWGTSMFKYGWFWAAATLVLLCYSPPVPGWMSFVDWWMITAGLFIWTLVWSLLNHWNTAYAIHGHFLQFRTGGLTSRLFISKREKMIEVKVTRNVLQRWLGLASVHLVNRARPVLHQKLSDVPADWGQSFYAWYAERTREVRIQEDSV
ncbi:PH domain-containing protein [Paenibacillus sp. A14]|uniref:PH domain-containing protein n=1 Tax=Paenibacillus sp. A14 TaxID=3119820 RepID=UPI002FDFF1DF